jgi:hypothetical protein
MALTQQQYIMLMNLSKTLPGVFSNGEGNEVKEGLKSAGAAVAEAADNVQPNVAGESGNLDFAFNIPVARLELFGAKAVSLATLPEASIAAFAINASHIQYQSRANGSSEANVTVKSIAMSNTRPGDSVYRELIPEGKRRGNQLCVKCRRLHRLKYRLTIIATL